MEFPKANAARLKNGLAISHILCGNSDKVAICIYLKCGSAYESIGNNGSVNILMRMIAHNPITSEKIHALGASVKTTISQQYIAIQLDGSLNKWHSMVEVLAEMVRCDKGENGSLFNHDSFTVERAACAAEASNRTTPGHLASSIMLLKLWGRRQLGLPVIGTPQHILELELSDIENFYNTWFSPEISLVIAAGSLPRDAYMQCVSENFKDWVSHAPEAPVLNRPSFTGAVLNTIKNATCGSRADILFAFSTSSTQGREIVAMNLLAEYLTAGGSKSYLQTYLKRVNLSPETVITANVMVYAGGAVLLLQIQTDATAIDSCLTHTSSALRDFIKVLLQSESGREGLEDCKRIMKTVIGASVSTPAQYANYYAIDRIFMGTSDPYNHFVAGMGEIDVVTFLAMASGTLQAKNLMVLVQSRDCKDISKSSLNAVANIGKN